LFRGNTGLWFGGDTASMIAEEGEWIHSASASHSPLDLEWLFYDFQNGTDFQLDPLLKITGF
jgi:hypothetical protein